MPANRPGLIPPTPLASVAVHQSLVKYSEFTIFCQDSDFLKGDAFFVAARFGNKPVPKSLPISPRASSGQ